MLASAELSEEDASKRPTVQIGDPFEEKKLLECCLELLERGVLRGAPGPRRGRALLELVRDGLEGRVGLDIDVSQRAAPRGGHGALRDHDLRVAGADALRGRAGAAAASCSRSASAGRCAPPPSARSPTRSRLRVLDGDELVGDMPVAALVDDCPLYDLEPERAAGAPIYPDPPARLDAGRRPRRTRCSRCSARPNVASKRFAFEQYDSIVGSRTVRRPETGRRRRAPARGATAAAARSRCRSTATAAAWPAIPYTGAVEAVLECARNLACVGAEPLGLTNCLNFGNPEKPHIAWQLEPRRGGPARRLPGARRAGGGRQRLALQRGRRRARSTRRRSWAWWASCPTPRARPVGRLRARRATRSPSSARSRRRSRARSSRSCAGRLADRLPAVDLAEQAAGLAALRAAVRAGGLPTAHDLSEGGLAVALAECCIAGGMGARVDLTRSWRPRATPAPRSSARARAARWWPGRAEVVGGLAGARVIGTVGGDRLQIAGLADLDVATLSRALRRGDPRCFA